MQVKKVGFRWLTDHPVAIDLRNNSALQKKYRADVLVLCMWIDQDGFLRVESVAGISMRDKPEVIHRYHNEIPLEEVWDCEALLSLRPEKQIQREIWNIRKIISDSHPVPPDLIPVRKTVRLDAFRAIGKPDIVCALAESDSGCNVLVRTEKFEGAKLLGTVVEGDEKGVLHKRDKVMLYTLNSIHHLERVLIATKCIYE